MDEFISLFDKYREYFGLNESGYLDKCIEFEDKFCELICKHKGHKLGPDHCGKPEHDLCYRCNKYANSLGFKRGPNGYIKIGD